MIEINEAEKILRVVRKHWFVLLSDIFFLLLFIALPPIFLIISYFLPFESLIAFSGNPAFAWAFILIAWLFLVWIVAWNMWTDYYLDVLLITSQRIFDIEQKGLFRRVSSSFRLDNVQNVTVLQNGIIQTMLNFGTMRLETAGEREDFIASYIADPYEIKKFINVMQDREEERSRLVHFEPQTDSEKEAARESAPL